MGKLDQTGGGSAKVPLVSEVLDRLLAQESAGRSRRAALFQAALQVCTDELRRVKKGATPAPLDTLVERARTVLATPAGAVRAITPEPSVTADLAPLLDDTAGIVRRAVSPLMPEALASPPAVVAPEAPLVVTHEPVALPEAVEADPFAVAAQEPPPVPAGAEPWPPPPPPPISFVELFPPAGEASDPASGEPAAKAGSRARLFVLVVLLGVSVGAAAWYFDLPPLRSILHGPTPVGPVAALARPAASPAPASAPPDRAVVRPPAAPHPDANPAMSVVAASPTPWDLTSPPTAVIMPAPAQALEPAPPAPRPARLPQHNPTKPPARATRPAAIALPASAQGRAAPMVSPDWAGHAPIYVLHFSSYHDRDKAVSDAARIAAEFKRPAYVAKVNLGAEGEWYRVVVGDFATADEAFAYRAELLARHVPDVAHVYLLTAPR